MKAPAPGQVHAAGLGASCQAWEQGLQACGAEGPAGSLQEPGLQKPALAGPTEDGELPSWQLSRVSEQVGQGQIGELRDRVLLVCQPLGQGRKAPFHPGMQAVENRNDLPPQSVAVKAEVVVAWIQPEGKVPALDDSGRVLAVENQQGPGQVPLRQGPAGAKAAEAAAMTAPGQVQHQGFSPITGGVAGDHMAALELPGSIQEDGIAPAPCSCFAQGLVSAGRSPVNLDRPAGPSRPLGQRRGGGGGTRVPAMVAMPEAELPAVQRAEILQQQQQGHRILAAGHRHQQARPRRQQGWSPEQMPVQAVMVRAPALTRARGRMGCRRRDPGWEDGIHSALPSAMSRVSSLPPQLQQALASRRLLKVIAGLTTTDSTVVARVSRAAGRGGADLVDVACEPALVRLAIAASGLPICVSAVDPDLFPAAVAAGAAMVEIGNFDAFYPQGRIFDAAEVLELTRRTRALLPQVVLSVTVPHVLPLDAQEQLAIDLVEAGADLIQTEGGTSARPFSAGVLGLIEKAAPTLAAAHAISKAVSVPVLCASGLSAVTVPMALAAGAAGVGVGSAINRLEDELAMVAVVRGLREAMGVAASELAPGRHLPSSR